MGDRTYMHLHMLKIHYINNFELIDNNFGVSCDSIGYCTKRHIFDWDKHKIEDSNDKWVGLNIDEINYGGRAELKMLMEHRFPFYGMHGAGGSYMSYVFAYAGGSEPLREIVCDMDGNPMVRIDHSDYANDDMRDLINYRIAMNKIKEL